jgi:ferrous iron transport protein B
MGVRTIGNLLEGFFARVIAPTLDSTLGGWLSSPTLSALFTGESGVLTFLAHLLTVVVPEVIIVSLLAVLLFLPVEVISRHRIRRGYGLFILFQVLYLGLYQFVGLFGAGSLVDFIESSIFETHINPFVTTVVETVLPWTILQTLFIGEYGIFTLGVRYAVALILPIVGTFFITFSVLEDTGYFPRLAMLTDRSFKRIGLSGRAVIPMVLGLGCDTMATMVTRILETKRERLISSLLLALAIPCSAQLGVILALLSSSPGGVLLWAGIVIGELLLIGYMAARVLPGETPSFYMELPPLRKPRLSNVLVKTYSRMQWYLIEVLPLFIIASALIWVGTITGLFQVIIGGLTPIIRLLGLPDQAAVAFLFGFFRRDYGAAGLFDMQKAGVLNGTQMVVAAVTLTLFLPCIAQFLIMKRERGLRATLAITGFVTMVAFATGWILNTVLTQIF